MARWLMGCLALAAVAAAPPVRSPLLPGPVLRGQKGEQVESLALSRDGKRLVAYYEDRTKQQAACFLRDWDAAEGRARKRLSLEHDLTGLALSPDGKSLAFASSRSVHVWDASTLTERSKVALEQDLGPVANVRFSTDGKSLGCIHDKGASLFAVGPSSTERPFRLKKFMLGAVFSPNSHLLAAPDEQDVDLWDVTKEKVIRTLGEHRGVVKAMAFAPDGKRLAAAASRLTPQRRYFAEVRLWEVATGKLLRTIALGECYPTGLAFSGDGKWLVLVGGRGWKGPGRLSLFDAEGVERASRTFPRKEAVLDLASASAATRFATSHADGSIRVWDVRPGR
jgi:WD40 repeat protein